MVHTKTASKTSPPVVSRLANALKPQQFFLASLVILFLALCTLGMALYVQHHTPQHILVETPSAGHAIGQNITQGEASIKVTSIKTSQGQPGFTAPEHKHYVIVTMHITNNVDHPIDVFPSSDMYIKDSAGRVGYLTPFALSNPFHAGALLPGESVQGELSFVVPDRGRVKLYVDSIWSGGVVPYKVQ